MDIISYNKAVQALRKTGFVGTKDVVDNNIQDQDIIQYSKELDKFITTKLRTKIQQWKQNCNYEKNEVVVYDDRIHWVLQDHTSHNSSIDYDIVENKIIPLVIEAGLPNILMLETEKISDDMGKITWNNPVSNTYEGREVYLSDSVDITVLRHSECVDMVEQGKAQLLSEGLGEGEGGNESFTFPIEPRKHYYVKIFVKHMEGEEEPQYSSGRFITLDNPDITPPNPINDLNVTVIENGFRLTFTQPTDIDFFHSKVIRASNNNPPENPDEGILVDVISNSGSIEIIDTNVQKDKKYIYRIFSYDDAGNGYEYGVEGNWSMSNYEEVELPSIYGFNILTQKRTMDAIGKTQKDFDNIYPWSEISRAVVDNKGQIVYYLDETNSLLQDDGVSESDLSGKDGNVVVEYPEFYYSYQDGNYLISKHGFPNAKFSPRTIVGCFEASVNELGELQSVINQNAILGKSITEYRIMAENIGEGWQQKDVNFLSILKGLFLVEYGSMNTQLLIGEGVVNTDVPNKTGGTVELGNKTGVSSDGSVSYRGLENPYGNNWELLEGLIVTDNGYYVAHDNFDSYIDENEKGSYQKINEIIPIVDDGFINKFENNKYFLGQSTIGNSVEYVGDYQYSHKTGETNIVVNGGNHVDKEKAGLFRLHMGLKPFGKEEEMEYKYNASDDGTYKVYEKELTENDLEKIKNIVIN